MLIPLSLFSGVLISKGGELSLIARELHTTYLAPLVAIVALLHSLAGIKLILVRRKLEKYVIPAWTLVVLVYAAFFWLYFFYTPSAPSLVTSLNIGRETSCSPQQRCPGTLR